MLSLMEVYSMTNPTPLSQAAKAVLDAFLKAPMGQSHVDDDLIAIAAALRAAITAIGSEEIFHPNSKRTEGVKWCVQRVYAIADELEAQ